MKVVTIERCDGKLMFCLGNCPDKGIETFMCLREKFDGVWLLTSDAGNTVLARGGDLSLLGEGLAPIELGVRPTVEPITYGDKAVEKAKAEASRTIDCSLVDWWKYYGTVDDFARAAYAVNLCDDELLIALNWFTISYERRALITLNLIRKTPYVMDGGALGIQTSDLGKELINRAGGINGTD